MNPLPVDKVQFDAKAPELKALTRDWADRECTPFDEAVRRTAGLPKDSGGSIWEMPSIDSKRVVSLLVELEPVLGCKLPLTLVKRGGYISTDDLVADLMPMIRGCCSEPSAPTANPQDGGATAVVTTSSSIL